MVLAPMTDPSLNTNGAWLAPIDGGCDSTAAGLPTAASTLLVRRPAMTNAGGGAAAVGTGPTAGAVGAGRRELAGARVGVVVALLCITIDVAFTARESGGSLRKEVISQTRSSYNLTPLKHVRQPTLLAAASLAILRGVTVPGGRAALKLTTEAL